MRHDTVRVASWCPRCGHELSFFGARPIPGHRAEDIYLCNHCGKGVGDPPVEYRQVTRQAGSRTMITDPDCPRCDGSGIVRHGQARGIYLTACPCLRVMDREPDLLVGSA